MVEYIIKKNSKRDTYYRILKNGDRIRITYDEYIKKVNQKQKGGDRSCESLLGNLHKDSILFSKYNYFTKNKEIRKKCYSTSKKLNIDGKICCVDKELFTDLDIKKNVLEYFKNTYRISNSIIQEPCIIDDPDCKLYIIGDMEGNVFMLYQWFLTKGFINEKLEWIHDNKNIYIVQCGDQVDGIRFENSITSDNDIDVSVLLFMDYMNYISKNHVFSIIGNHEWMNVHGDFRYVKENDNMANRLFFFKYRELLCKIIRRRNFVIRINNCIISHAGISYENIEAYKKITNRIFTVDAFIRDINNEVNKPENYVMSGEKRIIYNNVINSENGILWNRYYQEIVGISSKLKKYTHYLNIKIPRELKDYIVVKGHDKGYSVWFCYNNNNNSMNNNSMNNNNNSIIHNTKKCISDINNKNIDKISIITTDNIQLYYNILNYAELQYKDSKIIDIDKKVDDFSNKPITHTNLWRNIIDIYDSRIYDKLEEISNMNNNNNNLNNNL